jgi:hypothetical protein
VIEETCRVFFVNVMAARPFPDLDAAEACIAREVEPLLAALRALGDDLDERKAGRLLQ